MHENEEYYWRVSVLGADGQVSVQKGGMTWGETGAFLKTLPEKCSSIRLDREGLIDG